jgi:hypothetical protein
MSLLPAYPLFATAAVYTMGGAKYAPQDWRKGYTFREILSASIRHIELFLAGQEDDPEFGTPHLANAVFGCFCVMQYLIEGRDDLDDRPDTKDLEAIAKIYKLLEEKMPILRAEKAAREAGAK